MRTFAVTKIYDFAATLPLVLFYALGIGGLLTRIEGEYADLLRAFTVSTALTSLYQLATIAFMGLQIALFALRRLPERTFRAIVPRLAAVIGSNLPLLFLVVPQVRESFPVLVASTAVTIAGLVACIYIATVLGRCFSITPQARGLVTGGPYRLVRHPLYIAEQVAVFGIMWQFEQPWAFLIFLASVAAQFPRIIFEEEILSETYPEYGAYMKGTGRIVPRAFAPALANFKRRIA